MAITRRTLIAVALATAVAPPPTLAAPALAPAKRDRLIIGLCGPAKSGKSLAAEYLINNHGFARVRFAAPCEAMMRALGLTHDEIGPYKDRPCVMLGGKTPANAITALYTEWNRELINAWRAAVDRLPAHQPVVVEDCLFLNEANAVRALNGVVIGVRRNSAGIGHSFTADLRLENNGTVTELCDALDKLIAGFEPSTMWSAT